MDVSGRGFSLVELVVAIAIFSMLTAIGVPAFASWIGNYKIKGTAESIQAGLNLARGEAVRRNTIIRFQLVNSTDVGCALSTADANWVVSVDDPAGACNGAKVDDSVPLDDATSPRIIQVRSAKEGSGGVEVDSGANTFRFNGLGRLVDAPAVVDIKNSTLGACGVVRCLRVVVTSGGQVRMCDPAYSAGDTQGCS